MSLAGTSARAPSFPPLFRGEEAARGLDPMARAIAQASLGTDPGLIVWRADSGVLSAALVLAPEEPLGSAMGAVLAAALGLGDALGALAPPEVAVHYDWPGGLRVNGGRCGAIRAAASTADPAAEPDWLVVGFEIRFLPLSEDAPGEDPDRTALVMEGCGEVEPVQLLESWSRHTLSWINRLGDDGLAPLHRDWCGRAWGIGEELPGGGLFLGLDEHGGQLVRTAEGTVLRPLTEMLEGTA